MYFAAGPAFIAESLIYTAIKLFFAIPVLYWGTRTYRADFVSMGGWLLLGSCGLSIYAAIRGFGVYGLLIFGIYFDLGVSLTIIFGNLKNTYGYKFLKKRLNRDNVK